MRKPRPDKTAQANALASHALEVFELAHTQLLAAAQLADEAAVEHDQLQQHHAVKYEEAHSTALRHRVVADRLSELVA